MDSPGQPRSDRSPGMALVFIIAAWALAQWLVPANRPAPT